VVGSRERNYEVATTEVGIERRKIVTRQTKKDISGTVEGRGNGPCPLRRKVNRKGGKKTAHNTQKKKKQKKKKKKKKREENKKKSTTAQKWGFGGFKDKNFSKKGAKTGSPPKGNERQGGKRMGIRDIDKENVGGSGGWWARGERRGEQGPG